MADPDKTSWFDPEHDPRTGPPLEQPRGVRLDFGSVTDPVDPDAPLLDLGALARQQQGGGNPPPKSSPLSDRSFDVALAAYGAIFGTGVLQIAGHDWVSGSIFSAGGGLGLMSILPFVRPKLQVLRSNRSLWAMVTATWLFLAVNAGFAIYDHFWSKVPPSQQVSTAPDVWPALSDSQASALSARAQFLPPEDVVVACETIKCRDLADGIAAILNKTPNWKASILHRGGLDISGVVGIQLIPNEPATQQLKDAIEATTGLAVTLIETRKDMGTDARTYLTVGTRPF